MLASRTSNVSAWLPAHQISQGNCFEADANPAADGFQPESEVMRYFHVVAGQDNLTMKAHRTKPTGIWKGIARPE